MKKLHSFAPVASEFYKSIFFPYSFAFKSRTKSYRNIDFINGNLQTSYLYSFRDNLVIIYIGNHMLIGAYTSGKYFRNIRIGNGGESIIYGAGSIGVFFFIHFTKSQNKCKYSVFIIEKHSPVISGLNSSKAQSGPRCETK